MMAITTSISTRVKAVSVMVGELIVDGEDGNRSRPRRRPRPRFSGIFDCEDDDEDEDDWETVKTVEIIGCPRGTLLKQGVNESRRVSA